MLLLVLLNHMHVGGVQLPFADLVDRGNARGHAQQGITVNNAETHFEVIKAQIYNTVPYLPRLFIKHNFSSRLTSYNLIVDTGLRQITVDRAHISGDGDDRYDLCCIITIQYNIQAP